MTTTDDTPTSLTDPQRTVHLVVDYLAYHSGQAKVAITRAKALEELGYRTKIWTADVDFPFAESQFDIETLNALGPTGMPMIARPISVPEEDIVILEGGALGNFFLHNNNVAYINHGFVPRSVTDTRRISHQVYISTRLPQLQFADSIYSVSEYAKSQLESKLGYQSSVSYNPIDTNRFRTIATDQHHELGVLSGSRSLLNALEQTDINIYSPDFVPETELPKFYSSLSVFCHLTAWDSFGLPVVESMACGTPPVVLDNSVKREIVGIDELIASTPQEAIEIIKQLIDNDELRSDLAEMSRSRVENMFDHTELTRELINDI
ncbi:glycosyltransferase [Halobaculum sp. WSA2]|uniref:Glycosyltransferase n=1 Tax=Halobaculum saliterrae TaxID=2073113 RepID=A0A6B0SQK3_9EURY|nr:glycosyltransferase family 4 protein [Halobaculum saliterrae]MXR40777.1 glycosyltransferase [Halobaculum saliterrae]